jgi:hypothetical protein
MTDWWGAGEEGASWKTGSEGKRERMVVYIEWLMTPVVDRDPPSKQKLADALGVTTQTLRNYEKDPFLQRRLRDEVRAVARVDKIPEILNRLYEQATDPQRPSTQAAKVYLDYVERQVTEADGVIDVESMSSEDLVAAAMKVLQNFSQ